nr:MAG TPA: tail sheath protein [Caudoviricetes sp.]
MANIDRIVNVQISLNTNNVSSEGFNTILVVGAHMNGTERVKTYTNITDLTTDGFSTTDAIYKAVSVAFSQIPRPRQVKVGRRQIEEVNVSVNNIKDNTDYTVTISSKDNKGIITEQEYKFNSSTSATATTIVSGLQSVMTDDTVVTATVESENLKLVAKSSKTFSVKVSSNLSIELAEPTEEIADTMSAIMASDSDFYGIVLASRDKDDIMAMAEWVETQTKLFGTSTSEPGAKDSETNTDLLSMLKAKNYYRTFAFYHELADSEYLEAGVMARCFAIEPGGETWANKVLSGLTADNLTKTEYLAITNKNGNTFETSRNKSITQNGKVAGDEWIDVIRFRDWLQEEITVNVFNLLINSDKVPYTDTGIALVENQIRQALLLGQRRGGIAPTEYDEDNNENLGFTIEMPLAANIPANTKAQRLLENVNFTARLAGAIHVVEITGSFIYENLISE